MMAEVMLYNRDMKPNTYDTGNGVRLYSEDGSAKDFISANPVETMVQPDFSDGDMEVLPGEEELFYKVTIAKPPNLLPENISSGITIAGVKGTSISGSLSEKPIRFYDPYGNVIYGYTRAEIQEMEELPPGPTVAVTGVTFDRWTHTLDELKAVTYFADVGPMYKIGSTPVTVLIVETELANTSIPLAIGRYNVALKIYWGDGGTTSLESTSAWKYETSSHSYAAAGRHIITIAATGSGRYTLGYQSSNINYNVFGKSLSYSASTLSGTTPELSLISILMNSLELYGMPSTVEYAYGHLRLRFVSLCGTSNCSGRAFMNCPALKIIAGKPSQTIGSNAFRGAASLQRLAMSKTPSANAFLFCDSLKEVIFGDAAITDANMNSKWVMLMDSEKPPTISATSPVWGTYPIYVPDAAVDTYKTADGWSNASAYIFPASEYPDK